MTAEQKYIEIPPKQLPKDAAEREREAEQRVKDKISSPCMGCNPNSPDSDCQMCESMSVKTLPEGWTHPAPEGGIEGIVKRTQEISKTPTTAPIVRAVTFNDDQLSLLKAKVAPNATKTEFELLMYLSQKYNLDPLLRQIWLVKFGDSPAQIYAGRDGFLEIAHRSGQFDGMETKVTFDEAKKPVSAICTVWRRDMSHPFVAEVLFSEYTTGKNLWLTKPSVMIAKVSESVALRRAFSVSGLYCPEEIAEQK